ncbi:hypothetical protein HNQ60_005334 [Povalibacter uvarum]|uniref:Uncharacterized protein n=1 Tax=Povalibacter uvarum TaxID=732238 RepID=A0A841HWT4_9GAMM|nr:hypothetical protein [Povalibacter uvarum]MBB6096412.1 hypothetical protein [Povalibacter uvarum]
MNRNPAWSLVAAMSLAAGAAHAGPYSDDLAKCLVKSTTADDKGTLVRWIFGIAALHPQVSNVSAITEAQRVELNKKVAGLFESLLTERCRAQTVEAVRYEGAGTIEASFGILGEAAMTEMFSDRSVNEGLGEFTKYLNEDKLISVLGGAAADKKP